MSNFCGLFFHIFIVKKNFFNFFLHCRIRTKKLLFGSYKKLLLNNVLTHSTTTPQADNTILCDSWHLVVSRLLNLLNDLRSQKVDREELLKTESLGKIPKEISEAFRPSYYLPLMELVEKAEELIGFPPKKEEAEQNKASINQTKTNHRKERK